jgi:guanylate kinase
VSAPSGAGKGTILEKVLEADPTLVHSISATTRPPRKNEMDGREYYFLTAEEFRRKVERDGFIEWAEVHGHLYGTLRQELARCENSGRDVVFELDVQGMRNLKKARPEAVTVFVMPPSAGALEARLTKRGADSATEMALRLENARAEMAARHAYDYIIVNETVDEAVADFQAVVRAERRRSTRQH